MNFAFFDSLTEKEARDHLQGFLVAERAAIVALERAAEQSDVRMNYSLATLPSIFKWLLSAIKVIRVPVPDTEPEWIRQHHADGLIDFPDESKYVILKAAYYLGECFVRANNALSWTIGDPEFIEKNMPVVAGFRLQEQMAPMMLCENVFAGVLGDGEPESVIDTMVDAWIGLMP